MSCFGDLLLKDTGSSVRILHLAKGLAKLGNEIHIVIPGSRRTRKLVDGVTIHSINGIFPNKILKFLSNLLGVLRPSSLLLYDISFILRAYRLILRSDVIQVEQSFAGGLLTPFMHIFKKPLVVDSHDIFQALRTGHVGTLRKILETFLEKMTYKHANLILTVSRKEREFLIKYGIPQSKIEIVPNGVDTEAFTPFLGSTHVLNRYNLKDFYKVIFVGNLEYLPNQEAVHVVTSNLASKIQSNIANVKFLIIGRIPKHMRFPESPNLIFMGSVKNVAEFLAASDVAIAPLLHGSGTRLKILEYLASGLPVVSTTIGIKGLDVENGVNILIEDDMSEFAAKVALLLTDKVLSARLGKAGRELVTSKYDWQKIVRKLDEVYDKLLSWRVNTYGRH